MAIDQEVFQQAMQHALNVFPEESCGLVIIYNGRQKYIQCSNIAMYPEADFELAPEDFVRASKMGAIIGLVHSHPKSNVSPSQVDLAACEKSGLVWWIINPQTGEVGETTPSGYQSPLYGREYRHGIQDCYSFTRDFYKQECGIDLSDYDREEEWWNKGQSLYDTYFTTEGFIEIPLGTLRKYDALLINVESPVANHSAIYLGNNIIAHHLYKRLSSKDVYGTYYRAHTVLALRHRSMM